MHRGEYVPCTDTPIFYPQEDLQAARGAKLPRELQACRRIWEGEETQKYFLNDVIS